MIAFLVVVVGGVGAVVWCAMAAPDHWASCA